MSGDVLESNALDLYRTYDPPPKEFDLRTATPHALRRHGFPRRPNPETEPQLDRIWKHAFARTPNYVKAELAIDPVMSARDPLRRRGPEFSPSGWGGAVIEVPTLGYGDGKPATMVFAQWVVPEVVPFDPAIFSDLTVGFWVGIDGFAAVGEQVLQAGIAATVTPAFWGLDGWWGEPYAYVNWWAWTEWYTDKYKDPAVQVSNFPVATGNTVFFLVCAPQPDFGYVSMLNVSTGRHTSLGINARPGITSEGASVEWIVEGVSADLPAFYPVTFSGCAGGTVNHLFDLQPHGFPTEIEGSDTPLTQAWIASETSAVVEWTGWS